MMLTTLCVLLSVQLLAVAVAAADDKPDCSGAAHDVSGEISNAGG